MSGEERIQRVLASDEIMRRRLDRVLQASQAELESIDACFGRQQRRRREDEFETYTITEAAKKINLSRKTVYSLIREKRIPTIRVGTRQRISNDAIRRFLAV